MEIVNENISIAILELYFFHFKIFSLADILNILRLGAVRYRAESVI